ncbi:MAG: hypothetical protein AAFX79_02480 [Planctomycetota bacterium]
MQRILAALAVAAILVAVFVYVFAAPSGPTPGRQSEALPPPELQPGAQLGAGGQLAQRVDVYFQDGSQPGRTAARMIADEMAPDGPRRYRAAAPRVWLYQSSGRTIHVQSETGDLVTPSREQPPERGTLRGDVLVRLFDAGVATEPGDLAAAPVAATFRSESLDFNVELGTLSTTDVVRGGTDAVTFEARGLDVRGNEVTRQFERLESPGGGTASYTPRDEPIAAEPDAGQEPADATAGEPGAAAPRHPQRGAPADDAAAPDPSGSSETAGVVERFYHLRIAGGVVVERGGLEVDADTLDAWIRLENDRLADDAIAPLARRGGLPVETGARLLAAVLASLGDQATSDDRSADVPVTMTWSGPLVARPMLDEPPELAWDDIALRFGAAERGLVRLADAETSAVGHAAAIDYYPTTQRAVLVGPSSNSVYVSAPGVGEARGIRVELDLLAREARLIGPGQLAALGGDEQGSIAWAERADLDFVRLPGAGDAGEPRVSLSSADFRGKVEAIAGDARLAGDRVAAEFFEVEADRPLVRRLVIDREANQPASAGSDRAGRLTGDRIEVEFALTQERDRADPVRLLARGSVTGRDDRATFSCGTLDAALRATNEGRRIEVARAELDGGVDLRATDRDGVRIEVVGRSLVAEPERQYIEIIAAEGETAEASRGVSRIRGPQITLDGGTGIAQVFGPGSFAHELPGERGERPTKLDIAWRNFMIFDDERGLAEADGAVQVVATDERTEENRVAATNVQLAFARPDADAAEDDQPSASESLQRGERTLLWAKAFAEESPGGRVVVEIKRFARGGGLRSAVALLVPELDVDGATGDMSAPGAGRAIFFSTPMDDAELAGDLADEPGGLDALGGEGETLVDWSGGLELARERSRLVVNRGVRLSHRSTPEADQIDMDCETLTLVLEEGGGRGRSGGTALREARAEGAVYAATPAREIVARSLRFDARTGEVVASGDPVAPVVVFDRESAQPASAAMIRWNTETGEFVIERPLPTSGAVSDLVLEGGG